MSCILRMHGLLLPCCHPMPEGYLLDSSSRLAGQEVAASLSYLIYQGHQMR